MRHADPEVQFCIARQLPRPMNASYSINNALGDMALQTLDGAMTCEEEIQMEIPSGAPLWGREYEEPESYAFAAALFWTVFHLRQLAAALDNEEDQAVNGALDEIIDRFGLPMVRCRHCGTANPQRLAHLHQGDWIGECCWTESLRGSE